MKEIRIVAVIEFYQRDDETQEEVLDVAKGIIESAIGENTVKSIAIEAESEK